MHESFLERVRIKLNHEKGRNDKINRFFANDAKISFAGAEVLAEDVAALAGKIERLQQSLDALSLDRPTGTAPTVHGDEPQGPTDRPVLNDTSEDEGMPVKVGPKLVDKPCRKCGEMMTQVHPARLDCDKCKGAK